ncbi:hypothetical protein ABR759_02170 [Escherichia coli]
MPVPASEEEEINIVTRRVAELGQALALPAEPPALKEIQRVVQIFRELRNGLTVDGKNEKLSRQPVLSAPRRRSPLSTTVWRWRAILATACYIRGISPQALSARW